MKMYWSGGVTPRILNLGTRWRLVVTYAPAALPSGKEPRCPLDRRLSGSQNWSGCGGTEKSPPLPGIKPLKIFFVTGQKGSKDLNICQFQTVLTSRKGVLDSTYPRI